MNPKIATVIKDILTQVESLCSSYGATTKGIGRFRPSTFPVILISPGRTDESQLEMMGYTNTKLLEINFDIVVLVRDSEPDDWVVDVIEVMGPIYDAINTNPKLGGKAEDCFGRFFEPARLAISGLEGPAQKIYYGGMMSFTAKAWYL